MRNNVLTWDQLKCPSPQLKCILDDLFASYIPVARPYPVASFDANYLPLNGQIVKSGTDLYLAIQTSTIHKLLTDTDYFLPLEVA